MPGKSQRNRQFAQFSVVCNTFAQCLMSILEMGYPPHPVDNQGNLFTLFLHLFTGFSPITYGAAHQPSQKASAKDSKITPEIMPKIPFSLLHLISGNIPELT